MKNEIRFLFVSVLCLLAISLSSCNDSSDNNNSLRAVVSYHKTDSVPVFTDVNGNTYVPTSSSASSTSISAGDSDIVYISYTLNSTTTSSSVRKYNITLTGVTDLENSYNNNVIMTTKGAANDSINSFSLANDSIISVGTGNGNGFSMIGNHLMVYLNYYLGTGNCNYNNVFVYTNGLSTAKAATTPDTLKVWLSHHSVSPLSGNISYSYASSRPYMYYFGYNLSNAIAYARTQTSKSSVVVSFKAKVSPYGGTPSWSTIWNYSYALK